MRLAIPLVAAASLVAAHPSARAEADPLALARPFVRTFTERDGLPQATVHAVAFDREGYLWVGTQDGAARFDGRRFTTVDLPGRAVSRFVRAILPTRDGGVWFGKEEGGLVRLREGRADAFDRSEGLPAGRVNHLIEAADGTVWAATHGGGVARFTGSGFVGVSEGLPDLRVWRLLEGRGAGGRPRLLAACEGGVAELLDGGRWAPLDLGTPVAGLSVNSLLSTGEGPGAALWVGTFGAGVFRLGARGVERFGPDRGLAGQLVTSLAATRGRGGEDVVWAGTRDAGVFRFDGEAFEPVRAGPSLSEVYTLATGSGVDSGTLWVGTRLAGLSRVEETPWAAFDRATGLPGEQVFAFLEARGPGGRPAVWLGTNSGVAIIEDGRLLREGRESGLPAAQVRSLASFVGPDGRREVWASLIGAGLWRRGGSRWRPVEARPAFRTDDAGALLAGEDEDGRPVLWVGSERSGLGRLSGGRWRTLGAAEGLPAESVLSLLATRGPGGATLWVGTRGGGLAEIVGGRVVAVHDRRTGLPNNHVLALAEVTGPGGRRELWAGTRGGVARRPLDAPAEGWSVLSEESSPALPNDNVFAIAAVPAGDVFLGTNRGVARLRGDAAAAKGTGLVVYGTNEGLPGDACNQGSLVDSRGRVWISTSAGAAVFDPARAGTRPRGPQPLVVERVEVGGVARPAAGPVRVAPSARTLAFETALLAFHGEARIRYRTQLDGWEGEPSDWGTSPRREFTNLPPGRYVFRAWGRDSDGVESGPVEVPLVVEAPLWRHPAALALQAVLLAGLVLAALRLREAALRRRAAELEALVAVRTRELSEARDAAEAATRSKSRFLAHMSHEVRTPLNAIVGYSDLLTEELRDRGIDDLLPDLGKIRRAAEHQLAVVTEALDLSKIEAGRAELHLTEFDAGRVVRETLDLAAPLLRKGHNRLASEGLDGLGTVRSDESKLRQVLLNLLGNAARFTERGTITVEAERTESELTVRVRDTGIGMTPEQLERVFTPYAQGGAGTSSRYGGTGLGLAISRGYCELMRGALEVESEAGRGSVFTVRIPARLERRGAGR